MIAKRLVPENEYPARKDDDPSALTTQQLIRALSGLREIIEARLDGNDKAINLLQAATDRFPQFVDGAVRQLQGLHEEKFRSIAVQFSERDTRTEQTSRDSKVAVDAALQAAKEAVGEQNKSSALAISKSETATTKQIDQIGTVIATTTKGVDDKIDDIKARIAAIEGHSQGSVDTTGRSSVVVNQIIAGAMAFVVVAGAVVSAIAFMVMRH